MNVLDSIITAASFIRRKNKRTLIRTAYSLKGKCGLEIGGPSSSFRTRSFFPIYPFAGIIDSVNFSTNTVWEGRIETGKTFNYYRNKIGMQYVAEATDLTFIPDARYDFLISSHCLEHVANPLKALLEWRRVLKDNGTMILVLPNRDTCFDHKRPYTSFEHLEQDYSNNMSENDETHIQEIIDCYDEDVPLTEKRKLLEKNFEYRMAHHHVFSEDVINQMLKYCGFKPIYQQWYRPIHRISVSVLS